MDPEDNSNPQRMFDMYVYDYMVRKGTHEAAEMFRNEAPVNTRPIRLVDTTYGFLHEWWAVFYDVYMSVQENHAETSAQGAQANQMVQQLGNQQRGIQQMAQQAQQLADQQRATQQMAQRQANQQMSTQQMARIMANPYSDYVLRQPFLNHALSPPVNAANASGYLQPNQRSCCRRVAEHRMQRRQEAMSRYLAILQQNALRSLVLNPDMNIGGLPNAVSPPAGGSSRAMMTGGNYPMLLNAGPSNGAQANQMAQQLASQQRATQLMTQQLANQQVGTQQMAQQLATQQGGTQQMAQWLANQQVGAQQMAQQLASQQGGTQQLAQWLPTQWGNTQQMAQRLANQQGGTQQMAQWLATQQGNTQQMAQQLANQQGGTQQMAQWPANQQASSSYPLSESQLQQLCLLNAQRQQQFLAGAPAESSSNYVHGVGNPTNIDQQEIVDAMHRAGELQQVNQQLQQEALETGRRVEIRSNQAVNNSVEVDLSTDTTSTSVDSNDPMDENEH